MLSGGEQAVERKEEEEPDSRSSSSFSPPFSSIVEKSGGGERMLGRREKSRIARELNDEVKRWKRWRKVGKGEWVGVLSGPRLEESFTKRFRGSFSAILSVTAHHQGRKRSSWEITARPRVLMLIPFLLIIVRSQVPERNLSTSYDARPSLRMDNFAQLGRLRLDQRPRMKRRQYNGICKYKVMYNVQMWYICVYIGGIGR